MTKFIAAFDFHWGHERINGHKKPLHDTKAINAMLQFAADFKPDVFIIGGDGLDCGAISHHNHGKPGATEGLKLIADAKEFRAEVLDRIDALKPKQKVYITGNHECLSMDSRVLTKSGWVGIDDVYQGLEVYTLNPQTFIGEWQPIEGVIRKSYSGELLNFSNRGTDFAITPNHMMFKVGRHGGGSNLIPASEAAQIKDWMIQVAAQTEVKDYPLTDNQIAISGWFHTDGGYSDSKYRYPRFYQNKATVKDITDILDRLCIEYTLSNRGIRSTNFKGNDEQYVVNVKAKDADQIRCLVPSKKELPGWVWSLSARQLDVFIQACIEGDGTIPKTATNSRVLYTKHGKFAEQFMALGVMAGHRSSITEYRPGQWRVNFVLNSPTLRITDEPDILQVYDEEVWCVSVPNKIIMVERGGKCGFIGNCWLNQFVDQYPALEGIVDLESLLKLKDWTVIPQGGVFNLGKLTFLHGDTISGGEHCAKAAVMNYERSVRFGHYHTHQVFTKNSPLDYKNAKTGMAVPCLCLKTPGYGKGKPNRWASGFNWGYVGAGGNFNDYVSVIVDGQFIGPTGKLYGK